MRSHTPLGAWRAPLLKIVLIQMRKKGRETRRILILYFGWDKFIRASLAFGKIFELLLFTNTQK